MRPESSSPFAAIPVGQVFFAASSTPERASAAAPSSTLDRLQLAQGMPETPRAPAAISGIRIVELLAQKSQQAA